MRIQKQKKSFWCWKHGLPPNQRILTQLAIEKFKSHSPSALLILLLMWSAIYLMQLSVTSQNSAELKIWIVASQDDNHRPEKHQTSQEHLQVGWKPFSRSSAILEKTQHTRLQRQPIPTKRVQLKLLTVILCYQSRLLFWKILQKILSFTLFLTKLLHFLISKKTRDSTTPNFKWVCFRTFRQLAGLFSF